jgi:BirA family biotin operon repressor/biotin-[acetyl-CoA-carboxylase] ligase
MAFALGAKASAAGYRLEEHETIGSTNAVAMARARDGDAGRLWVVCDFQSEGRGRRGSQWATAKGNLASSLFIAVDAAPGVAATLGFVAGLSLDEALRRVAPSLAAAFAMDGLQPGADRQAARLRLKWPNDVLLDGGKLAGILLEAAPLPNGKLAVVIGIGVNVVEAPSGLPYPTAALAGLGIRLSAADLFAALSDCWSVIERIWDGGRGFPRIRDLWLDRAAGVGEEAVIRIGQEVMRGRFETIDSEGRLMIRLGDGTLRPISAGEVHFGAMAGRA